MLHHGADSNKILDDRQTVSGGFLVVRFVSRYGGSFSVVYLAIWTRLSSSQNTTMSSQFHASCKRFSQWPSIRVRVRAKHFFMFSKPLASFRERSLVVPARFAICDDNSKQVIKESWNTSSTSLTLLKYSIDMESASSTESPVVRAREISSV